MEIAHARLVGDLSSSDPAKRIAGLSTVIQLANLGHDVSEYALIVLEKGFANKQSTPLAHRLSYHLISIMHLDSKGRDALAAIMKKGLASEDPEVATAALRALAQMSDTHLLHTWPSIEAPFAACLSHRNYKVREAAVMVMLAHIRSTSNHSSGVAMYHDTLCKSLFESNAEVVDGAFHVLRELMAPSYPLYFYQEPPKPLYYSDAADAFAKEYIWFSRILSRVPLCSRAHALRPVTLLFLHLDCIPVKEPQQSTPEDFIQNQLISMLQFTGAVDVALEASHCILLICKHYLQKEVSKGEDCMPEWMTHALWRVACCLLTLLNATMSQELKGIGTHIVLEAACLARMMTSPDHIHSLCGQLLHYATSCPDKVKVQLIQLCMTRLLEGYALQVKRVLSHRTTPEMNTLVPLPKIGWWAFVMDGENSQYEALKETAVFVMLSHLYGLLTRTPASNSKCTVTDVLPLLAVAAQVTNICSESLEWGYKTTRQFVVLSAYLKLLTHLVAELQIWRHVRADEQVEKHVADCLQDVYMVVQKTLINVTQSTGVPMPTAVKGLLHCLLLYWAQAKKGDQAHEIFIPAVEFLRAFMEKVPYSSLHEPTAAMLVNHLLSYHSRKGNEATAESLQQMLEAVPKAWAKVATDFQGRQLLMQANACESVKPQDIHGLSSRFMGLALDTMSNTNADWALVASLVNAHPTLIAGASGPLCGTVKDTAASHLRHLLVRHLKSALFEPPPEDLECDLHVLHRASPEIASSDMVSITCGYKVSTVCPVLWTYVKVMNNSEATLKNVQVTIGAHGSVVAFSRYTTRPHELYDQGEMDSLQVTSMGFQDLIAEILPGRAGLVYRCAIIHAADPENSIHVRVDLPRTTRSDILGTDAGNSGPPISLYNAPLYISIPHSLQAYQVPEHLVEHTVLALSYTDLQEVAYSQRTAEEVYDHITTQMAAQKCFAPLQLHGPQDLPNAFRCTYSATLRFSECQEPVLLTAVGTSATLRSSVVTSQGEALAKPCTTFSLDANELTAEVATEEVVICSFVVRGSSRLAVQCLVGHPDWAMWLRALYRMEA